MSVCNIFIKCSLKMLPNFSLTNLEKMAAPRLVLLLFAVHGSIGADADEQHDTRRLLSRRIGLLSSTFCPSGCPAGTACNVLTGACDVCGRNSYQDEFNMTSCQDCGQWVKTKSGKQWKKQYTFVTGVTDKAACVDLLLARSDAPEIAGWIVLSICFILPWVAVCVCYAIDTDAGDLATSFAFFISHGGTFIIYICLGCAIVDQPESFTSSGFANQYKSPGNSHYWMIPIVFLFTAILFFLPFGLVCGMCDEDGDIFEVFKEVNAPLLVLAFMMALHVIIGAAAASFYESVPDTFHRDGFVDLVTIEPRAHYMAVYAMAVAFLWVFVSVLIGVRALIGQDGSFYCVCRLLVGCVTAPFICCYRCIESCSDCCLDCCAECARLFVARAEPRANPHTVDRTLSQRENELKREMDNLNTFVGRKTGPQPPTKPELDIVSNQPASSHVQPSAPPVYREPTDLILNPE